MQWIPSRNILRRSPLQLKDLSHLFLAIRVASALSLLWTSLPCTSPTSRTVTENSWQKIGDFLSQARLAYRILRFPKRNCGGQVTQDDAHAGVALPDTSEGDTCKESCIVYNTWCPISYGTSIHYSNKCDGPPWCCACMLNIACLWPRIWCIICSQARSVRQRQQCTLP